MGSFNKGEGVLNILTVDYIMGEGVLVKIASSIEKKKFIIVLVSG